MAETEIITFGCRLNAFESEVIRRAAATAGLTEAVIVNTCAVTAEAVRNRWAGEGDEQCHENTDGERDGVGGRCGGSGARVVLLPATERDARCCRHLEECGRPADEVEDRRRESKPAELRSTEVTDDCRVGDRVERLDHEGRQRRQRESDDAAVEGVEARSVHDGAQATPIAYPN